MTALDVSPWVGENNDSPELAAFKDKVIKVAEIHSRRHHCGSIDEALKDLGISKARKITVKVTTSLGLNTDVQILPTVLNDKGEEEQKQALSEAIGPLALSGSTGASFSLTIAPEMITSMEISTPLPGEPQPIELAVGYNRRNEQDPNGEYMWGYVSHEGRIIHRFDMSNSRGGWGFAAACRSDTTTSGRGTPIVRFAETPEQRVFCSTCLNRAGVDQTIRDTLRENNVQR